MINYQFKYIFIKKRFNVTYIYKDNWNQYVITK